MTTEELDKALMGQYTIESMLGGAGKTFEQQLADDFNIAALQQQGTDFCFKSKGFLCSHYVSEELQEAVFVKAIKAHMNSYRSERSNRNNLAMKHLYSSDVKTLCQQISMLAMHSQYKDVEDINNVDNEIAAHSLDPESVTIAIALYVYYVVLENTNVDILSYNELFIKSWYIYYEQWQTRRFLFQMNGNSWKTQFSGVLLD